MNVYSLARNRRKTLTINRSVEKKKKKIYSIEPVYVISNMGYGGVGLVATVGDILLSFKNIKDQR